MTPPPREKFKIDKGNFMYTPEILEITCLWSSTCFSFEEWDSYSNIILVMRDAFRMLIPYGWEISNNLMNDEHDQISSLYVWNNMWSFIR